MIRSEIDWRGNRLLVREGTRLEPAAGRRLASGQGQVESLG
jgi:hypothetical protein